MNPKEKATQLVDSYELALRPLFGINDYAEKYYHKQCALIAVNEIIEVAYWNSVKDFYKEVKQEIENN